jgi:hypothetical protein
MISRLLIFWIIYNFKNAILCINHDVLNFLHCINTCVMLYNEFTEYKLHSPHFPSCSNCLGVPYMPYIMGRSLDIKKIKNVFLNMYSEGPPQGGITVMKCFCGQILKNRLSPSTASINLWARILGDCLVSDHILQK